MWEITYWDKRFTGVEKNKQPKIMKYPYATVGMFSGIELATGDVRLISTGNYTGYTTERLARDYLCQGEIIAIPGGGSARIKYHKGKFVTTDNRIAVSRDRSRYNTRFISVYLASKLDELQGLYRGAVIQHPEMTEILEMPIAVPVYTEQEQIGNLFTRIDSLIQEQENKVEKLKQVKQGLLDKMFPTGNTTKPVLRFKGYEEEWKRVCLGDITRLITSGATPPGLRQYTRGDVNFIKVESINKETAEVHPTQRISNEIHNGMLHRSRLERGDILFSIAGTVGRVCCIGSEVLPANINQAIVTIRLKSDNSTGFIQGYLQSTSTQKYIHENLTVGAQPNLSISKVSGISLPTPVYQEQDKIGSLFGHLDKLYVLECKKLEKYRGIKQGLLDKVML